MLKARPMRYTSLLILCFLVSGCALGGGGVPRPTMDPPTPPVSAEPATVTIGGGIRAAFIPTYFVGFSIEPQGLCTFLQLEQSDPAVDRLYENLGPSTIRFGGNSMDASDWQPYAPCSGLTFGATTIRDAFAFAQRVHARVIWGLNLKSNDPNAAADEADTVYLEGAGQLLGLEMGNEPNNWTTEPTYERMWQSYASAIAASGINPPLVGPSMNDGDGHSWFAQSVRNERSQLAFVTYHYYPLQQGAGAGNGQVPTIQNLLSATLMASTAADLDRAVAVAHANGLALDIDETNSVNGGGVTGVSNTFASSLWMVDYLFTAMEHGVLAVNVHGSGGASGGPSYSPIVLDPSTHELSAQPMYYGMLLFHLATGNGESIPLRASVASSANLAAHVVLGRDGTLRVALINKDLESATRVRVKLGVSGADYRAGSVIRLMAPSVTATNGVMLGGASVGVDGSWSPTEQESIRVSNSSFTIVIPKASAALVTLSSQN